MLAHLGINRHALFETVANALVGAFASGKQPKGLPGTPSDEEAVEKRGANSRRNPSALTLQGTNTYLVGMERFMVDRRGRREKKVRVRRRVENGDEGTQSETFARDLLTHWHPDHAFGVSAVRKACGDERLQAFKMVRKEKRREIAVARRTDEDDGGEGKHTKERRRHYVDIRDGDVFKCTGATLVAMHLTTREDPRVFQLLGDDDEGDAVFAGDCLMNGSTAEFEDLSAYSRSLRNCLKRSRSPTRLVAGKPSLVTAKERTRR